MPVAATISMERKRKTKIDHYEVQILESGEKCDSAYDRCPKQKHHQNYININELSGRLPLDDSDVSSFISHMYNLTAIIEIPAGQRIRCGSCLVQKIEMITNIPCPCPECKGKGVNQWAKVTLSTALHVIEDQKDAEVCRVRLFYDSPDSQGEQKILHGLKSHTHDGPGDWCALVCVTHDLDLLDKLKDNLTRYWNLGRVLKERYEDSNQNLVVVVSHPHGGHKRVSIGKGKIRDLGREVRDDQDWCFYSYDATTCDGSSGGAVYVLGRWNDGFGYWFGHSHNHSGIDERSYNSSTIGVDTTYGRLTTTYSSCEIDEHPFTEDRKPSDCVDVVSDPFTENIESSACADVLSTPDLNGTLIDSHLAATGTYTCSTSTNGKVVQPLHNSNDNMTELQSGTKCNVTESHRSTYGKAVQSCSYSKDKRTESHSRANGKVIESHSSPNGKVAQSHSSTYGKVAQSHSSTNGKVAQSHSSTYGKVAQSHSSTNSKVAQSHSSTYGKVAQSHSSTNGKVAQSHSSTYGKVAQSHSSTYGKVAQSHSSTYSKVAQSNSSTYGKVAQSHSGTYGNVANHTVALMAK